MRIRPRTDAARAARSTVVLAALASALLAGCAGAYTAPMAVSGRVELGPLCPVERADSPCPVPPAAFAGVEVVATSGEDEERVPVAADGTFTLSLAAGSWEVTSTAGMSCTPITVSVAGQVVITCDTGIR